MKQDSKIKSPPVVVMDASTVVEAKPAKVVKKKTARKSK